MESNQIVQDFLSRVSDPKDKVVLGAFNLTPREMELFLAALNALPEDSLAIPGLREIVKKIELSGNYVQLLKKKKLFSSGPNFGEWQITETAIKKMASFLKNEPTSAEPKAGNRKKTRDKKKSVKRETKLKFDIGKMSISQISQRLAEIEEQMQTLSNERDEIRSQVKKQLTSIK